MRTAKDGIHTENSIDVNWNNHLKSEEEMTPYIIRWYESKNTCVCGQFILFNVKKEKDNFTDFWYRNGKDGLMHKLIKGLNKSSGTIELAIPRVDWSHPWTDEEILKEYGYTEEEIKEILE